MMYWRFRVTPFILKVCTINNESMYHKNNVDSVLPSLSLRYLRLRQSRSYPSVLVRVGLRVLAETPTVSAVGRSFASAMRQP